jgi:hypothetical protein
MTHYKWLVAKRTRAEAEDYALRVQDQEGYDYCEVQEHLGTVEQVYEKLLKEGFSGSLARLLRMNGIAPEDKPQWLENLIRKGKGGYKVFIVDCHD